MIGRKYIDKKFNQRISVQSLENTKKQLKDKIKHFDAQIQKLEEGKKPFVDSIAKIDAQIAAKKEDERNQMKYFEGKI